MFWNVSTISWYWACILQIIVDHEHFKLGTTPYHDFILINAILKLLKFYEKFSSALFILF